MVRRKDAELAIPNTNFPLIPLFFNVNMIIDSSETHIAMVRRKDAELTIPNTTLPLIIKRG
jgi:hypothetical protein